jgi:hypothetical protein
VAYGDKMLIDTRPQRYPVSAGGLHLLRTLRRNHTKEDPIAENLIPHCGHFMAIVKGELTIISCPEGLNWWVRHEGDSVKLDCNDDQFKEDVQLTIPSDEWSDAVKAFARVISNFYGRSAPKTPGPEDAEWYAAFWREWRQLCSTAEER